MLFLILWYKWSCYTISNALGQSDLRLIWRAQMRRQRIFYFIHEKWAEYNSVVSLTIKMQKFFKFSLLNNVVIWFIRCRLMVHMSKDYLYRQAEEQRLFQHIPWIDVWEHLSSPVQWPKDCSIRKHSFTVSFHISLSSCWKSELRIQSERLVSVSPEFAD